MRVLAPPIVAADSVDAELSAEGHAVLDRAGLCRLAAIAERELDLLVPFWERLPLDAHLRDDGRYRRRRHGCFLVRSGDVRAVPHRAHWQPIEYNALHGGIERWFEPLEAGMSTLIAWPALLGALAARASALRGEQPWFVEAHPFRIEAGGGIGRPTPEGAHRDGVDFVAVILVARVDVKGGETRVFDADGPTGLRFTLTDPWTALLLDDERVVHETTPIQPVTAPGSGAPRAAHRDTLVLTFRAGGFQGPA